MVTRKKFFKGLISRNTVNRAEDSAELLSDSCHEFSDQIMEPVIPEFSYDQVYYEAMRLGYDPSAYSRDQIYSIVLDEMKKQRISVQIPYPTENKKS